MLFSYSCSLSSPSLHPTPALAFLCSRVFARSSQNKSWVISKEKKIGSKGDHSYHPSQRQPRSANSQPTSRVLIKPSFDQQKHLTNLQLTPDVQAINAYSSVLIRFCNGSLLSITVAIITHAGAQILRCSFSFDTQRKTVRGFLIEKITIRLYSERNICFKG